MSVSQTAPVRQGRLLQRATWLLVLVLHALSFAFCHGCSVLISAEPHHDCQERTWVLEGGVKGHWSQGIDILVFECEMVNLVLMASGCEAAEQQPVKVRIDTGEHFIHRGSYTSSEQPSFRLEIPGVSESGIDVPLLHLADGMYNLTAHFGHPLHLAASTMFAKLSPHVNPALEVMFPPQRYTFGNDMEPFLQVYVQDRDASIAASGTTAGASKQLAFYLNITIRRLEGEEVVEEKTVMEWSPNSRKIFLGRHMEASGTYKIEMVIYDAVLRPTDAREEVLVMISHSSRSPLACIAGEPECTPQATDRTGEEWFQGGNHSTFLDRLVDAVQSHCPQISPQDRHCRDKEQDACSGHGWCLDSFCYCYQDYAGPKCDTHLLSALQYLPSSYPTQDVSHCHQSIALSRGMEGLSRTYNALQNPAVCDDSKSIQRRFNKTQGLGVTFRWLSLSLLLSLAEQKTLLIGGKWRAFNFEGCSDRGLWCYLLPSSNCSVSSWRWEEISEKDFYMPQVLVVPSEGIDQGQLWWSSQMTHLIMRPSVDLKEKVRRIKNSLSWSGRVVGLHVRHGDSCADIARRRCLPAGKYLEVAEEVLSRYRMDAIYLATDDPVVVEEAKKRGVRYISAPIKRHLFSNHMYIEHRLNLGVVDRKGVSDATFIDLMLLRDCDALVGTFGSHFSKVAYELSVGAKGYFPPFVSLDDPWTPLRPIASSCSHPQCIRG